MTKVKICGLTDQATIDGTVAAGADYLGFVFAPSKRQITPEKVRILTRHLSKKVQLVGVFVSPTWSEVEAAIGIAKLDLIQIHGTLSATIVENSSVPIIQSFNGQSPTLAQKIKHAKSDFILLDAPVVHEVYAGGNGKTFDWARLSSEAKKQLQEKACFIAGGLTKENVQEAMQFFQPYGVDVSSSVETNGQKDLTKIQAFIKAVKGF